LSQGNAASGLSIRPARQTDIAFSAQLNADEGWSDTPDDIARLIRCEPRGFLIAELQGKPVGQILSISYGKLGWIGYLIVLQEYRRQGIGSALMRAGIARLKLDAQTIELDARPEAISLYEQMGFEAEYKTWKYRCVNRPAGAIETSKIEVMHDRDLAHVSTLDKSYFFGDRSSVLEAILVDNRGRCYVANLKGTLRGYVMCRPTRIGFRIGPFVSDPDVPEVAETLLVAAMKSIPLGATISISAPETNRTCLDLLSKYGFERLSPNVRMFLGKKLDPNGSLGIFALGGLEKG